MDFFTKLFSPSSQKKTEPKAKESLKLRRQARSELNVDERYHESGTFCRESLVDQIEASACISSSGQEQELVSPERISSTPVIVRTLDCWNPETCVRLLRMPSVQNYSGLRKLITESDKVWMIEFLQMGGLEVLFESVDRLSNKKGNQARLEHTLLLLQCVSCLKAVTNSHNALEYVVSQRTYSKQLAEVLCSENPLVKKQLFEFMSTLCIFSEEGHHLTLDTLESYRVTQKLRYRFAVLMAEIKQAEVLPYVAAVLGVINCVILGVCGFRFRTRIRNEFIALGLLDLLESLKQLPDEDVQMQCSVFGKSQMADEEHAQSLGIRSSFSHFALFQALLDKVEDTPLSASFLVLLQNLNQLDPSDSKTDYVWSTLEEMTEQALNGADSVLRSWMTAECQRGNLRTRATQTVIQMSQLFRVEKIANVPKNFTSDETDTDSLKSFCSRDSGMPVSRTQSFASSGPRSPNNTLTKQDSVHPEMSENPEEILENDENEGQAKSNGFFRSFRFSYSFSRNSVKNHDNASSADKQTISSSNDIIENSQHFYSECPLQENGEVVEENNKAKKSLSLSFFNRSRKYSLVKPAPKVTVQPPSPDLRKNFKQYLNPASAREGMTSTDLKRSRKQLQNSTERIHNSDNSSISSSEKIEATLSETNSPSLVFHEISCDKDRLSRQTQRSVSTSEVISEEPKIQIHLSKSTSDLTQTVPPPPPPPPPPSSLLANLQFRQKTPNASGSQIRGNRASWSGGSFDKEFEDLDKKTTYNTLPRPKSKMKTFNWAKIPSGHVSVHSIWSEINQESKTMEVNFEEVEKLFCQEETAIKAPKVERRQRVSEISLLDSKRSLSICVFLKQFKGGLEEVVEFVRQCEHKKIGAEKLRTLLHLLPEPNEIKLLTSYSGDFTSLGNAEKFLLRLNSVDNYDCRIEGMLLLEELPTTLQNLEESIQQLFSACSQLLTNKEFKNFLKLILVTGNFINSGSYAGNAIGFRLSTLPKLMEARTNKPRITLLHYLVDEAKRKDPESLNFTNAFLEKLKQCSKLTLDTLLTEIAQLDKTLGRLDSRVQKDGGLLKKKFGAALQNGIKRINALKKKTDEIRKLSIQLAERFCEDEKKFKVEECLNAVNVFCLKIKMVELENQARKTSEEKKRKGSGNKDSRAWNPRNCTL
ncbi:inverted formin-2-like [Uloborus diversus]|uniref:inverted formin-2-like n=1 Tax=Uloborus diversus TaxID=327109 RepID=UPI002409B8BB|nr:inverted formin-2-like [Uloborus diversus]